MKRITSSLFLASALLLGACAIGAEVDDDTPSPAVQPGLDSKLDAVATATAVPAPLLKAIGYVETRWQNVSSEEHEGVRPRFGVMGLDTARLERGAGLIKRDILDVQVDPQANIEAAAALLLEAGRASGATAGDLASWASAVGTFSGLDDVEARQEYVAEVYNVLRTGARSVAESGELIAQISAQEVPVMPRAIGIASADYGPAIFRSSPNFNARPAGTDVSMVVIHSCEGGYAGCWSWLRNPSASASAHYVVKEDGGEITQLVREADRAWHIAAAYRCNLNSNVDCGKNGVSTNHFSVGIEHGGFASQASWPANQIEESAKLTCNITRNQGIVRDRNHIVAHGQLQPETRTDPGRNWPWASYIERVRQLCGDGGTPPPTGGQIIVDSNNDNNDLTKARIDLTGTWTSATGTPGYYGSGYWYAATEAASAPATFSFYLAAAGTRTIDAWWTAGTNRAAAAPFIAYNAAGTELGRVSKDQRTGGGQWNALGTWNFSAGWNTVVLSRWTSPGAVVIADAIRVR
jgi:N-acetyl-anhydromuramyl-L-alanine amidase AmpD